MRLSHVEAFSREQCWLEGTLLRTPPQLVLGLQCRADRFPMNVFWPNPDAL